MSVTITLEDELAKRLEQQAQVRRISLQEWAIRILSRAPEFADNPDAWHELNARRFQLIHKRHHGGLFEAEKAELADLQAIADQWLEPIDRQRLDMLKPYEELAHRLMQQTNE